MEEPGSIDYVAEGEAMRIYGFIGCALYVLAFCPILYSLYKRKQSIVAFLLSMLFGGGICGVYLFVLRLRQYNANFRYEKLENINENRRNLENEVRED